MLVPVLSVLQVSEDLIYVTLLEDRALCSRFTDEKTEA